MGGLFLGTALVVLAGIKPYLHARDNVRSRLAVEQDLLGRERALLRTRPQILELAALSARAVELRRSLLFQGDDGLATAEAQRYLSAVMDRAGLQIQSIEPGQSVDLGGTVQAVPIRLSAHGDFASVLVFLHSVGSGPKLVRVEHLAIERTERGSGPMDGTGPQPIAITAEVTGYALAHDGRAANDGG